MEANELERLIGELEIAVDRLRSLYEQYFMGIERIEPHVPRKDCDRRVYVLRKEQIRNTALRFRFQMLLQRYNTYQTHWQRICRDIENGTYKRHVVRAQKRFGIRGQVDDPPAPNRSRRRRSGPSPTSWPSSTKSSRPRSRPGPRMSTSRGTTSPLPPPSPAAASRPRPRGCPRPLRRYARRGRLLRGPRHERPATGRLRRPAPGPKTPRTPAADPKPPPRTRPPSPPGAAAQAAPTSRLRRQPRRRRQQPEAVVEASRRSRPAPPAPSKPAAACVAKPRRRPSPDDRVRQLYSQYVETRRRQNESTATITYDSVARNLRESSAKLRAKLGRNVDFEVIVKDGRTILRPVVK